MKEIKKNFEEMTISEKLAIKNGYAKAIDVPADFRISSVLNPEEIDSLVPYVQAQDKLLKMINIRTITGTTANLNDYNTSADGTHAPSAFGTYPSDTTTNIDTTGNAIVLYPLQELYVLKDAVLQDNLWKPNFENSVMNALSTQWSNSLAKLAMVGTAFSAGSFGAMLKGFPQLFVDAVATVNDITFANYTDPVELLDAMYQSMPEKYCDIADLTFVLKKSDHDKLWSKLQSSVTTGLAYTKDEGITFKGLPVIWFNAVPTGKAFLTPMSNLGLFISQGGMKLETERQASAAAEGVFMNYFAAFGVYNYEAVVYAS